jgi:hypothetical protein
MDLANQPVRTDPYGPLFDQYVVELRSTRAEVMTWWEQLHARETAIWGDKHSADQAIRMRWPLGPVAHPRVIAVYRKYYLEIDRLNRELTDDEGEDFHGDPLDAGLWVDDSEELLLQHPRAVLYERLEDVDTHLARFMDPFVFVPIGADADGRLV